LDAILRRKSQEQALNPQPSPIKKSCQFVRVPGLLVKDATPTPVVIARNSFSSGLTADG